MLKKAIDIKTFFKTTSNKNVQFLMRTHGETATKFYNIVSDLVQDKDYVLSELGSELGRTFALLRTDTLRFFSLSLGSECLAPTCISIILLSC